MNPEQWLSLKWNGDSTMSDRWLNQSKIIQYWWGMSAQLKLIIDKCYCRGLQLKNKKLEQSLWEDPRWIVSSMS